MSLSETYRLAVAHGHIQDPLPPSKASRDPKLFNNCHISYGLPFQLACAKHVESTFHASRAYILASRTLSNSSTALQDLQEALGDKAVGIKTGLQAHTSWNDVLSMKRECIDLKADIIITLGGGTLTDAAKLLSLVLANDVNEPADFHSKLDIIKPDGSTERLTASPPTVPVICVPTTLSAGEYTLGVGATEDATGKKYLFMAGHSVKLIVLDAKLVALTTPLKLYIASGFRAVDHCVEAYVSPQANVVTEVHALAGLRLLVRSLLLCRADEEGKDIEVRHLGQMGAIEAIAAVFRVYTPGGGSHAIGHMLGPFGVGHGETSAILLPAVCAYNAKHGGNVERQRALAGELWGINELRVTAEKHGLKEGAELGEVLRALTRELGLPTTLKDVGVEGDKVGKLAEYSLLDFWMRENPVPLRTKDQVLELLAPILG